MYKEESGTAQINISTSPSEVTSPLAIMAVKQTTDRDPEYCRTPSVRGSF
jgi:hypothetical protein